MVGEGETERITRKERIDPKLDAAGWRLRGSEARRTEEEPTANGPADYALWLQGSPYDFSGFRAPFLYSTNGEVFWFHDVRHPLNRSRRVAGFHTPAALRELLGRDLDAAIARLRSLPKDQWR